MNKGNDRVKVKCQILEERPMSLHIKQGSCEYWIPRSLCHHISKGPVMEFKESRDGVLTLPLWIAEERAMDFDEE